MSNIKKLSEKNDVSTIDTLKIIYPSVKGKYHEMMYNIIKNESNEIYTTYNIQNFILEHSSNRDETLKILNTKTNYEKVQIYGRLFSFFNYITYSPDDIKRFIEYCENGLITNKDLTSYKTFEEIKFQNYNAEISLSKKTLEKEIITLFEDEEWLIIKPLTHESSVKYGYGTKWCTAMFNDPGYFANYTCDGILIYCINQKTKEKYGCSYSFLNNDASFWNDKDQRVDSYLTGMPNNIIELIFNDFKNRISNKQVYINKHGESPFKNMPFFESCETHPQVAAGH